jgi:hypothetical protein
MVTRDAESTKERGAEEEEEEEEEEGEDEEDEEEEAWYHDPSARQAVKRELGDEMSHLVRRLSQEIIDMVGSGSRTRIEH